MPAVLDLMSEASHSRSSQAVNLTAVHLVGQVLEEACAITTAAYESGQPWLYFQTLKKSQNGRLSGNSEKVCVMATQGLPDTDSENNSEVTNNLVVTSTPQKLSDDKVYNDVSKLKVDNNLIGQGDEEGLDSVKERNRAFGPQTPYDFQNISKFNLTTDMFINNLFDMSEVEKVMNSNEAETVQESNIPTETLRQVMTKIMDSYVDNAFNIGYVNEKGNTCLLEGAISLDADSGIGYSKEAGFTVDSPSKKNFSDLMDREYKITEITEDSVEDEKEPERSCTIGESDVAFYEKSYLTLNRDCEQASDEEHEVVQEDSKEMIMQEVDLSKTNVSHTDIKITICEEPKKEEISELKATSNVSDIQSSKLSLINRCKSQGARLISRLRGWWLCRTPTKRRESRYVKEKVGKMGAVESFLEGYVTISKYRANCAQSPDVHRRATSLLDIGKGEISSPSFPQSASWKFNTINESLCNASRWNNYTFESKTEELELGEKKLNEEIV